MVKLRTQQIIIDLPRTRSEPWIFVKVQRVELAEDGITELHVQDNWGAINKKLSEVALEVNPYFEAIPGVPPSLISVYGLSDGIKEAVIRWIIDKFGGTLNQNGDVIL
jgi:hypothetical protein